MSIAPHAGWLKVQGLDCPTEEAKIRGKLETWPGLTGLEFDLGGGRVRVSFNPEQTSLEQVRAAIESQCGYGCRLEESFQPTAATSPATAWQWLGQRGLLVILAGLAELAGLVAWAFAANRLADTCFALSMNFSALWIGPRAWDGLRRGRMDIFLLVFLALIGAVALGQWDEAATVGVLFGVSELLESFAARRARVSIQALIDLQPDQAELLDEQGQVQVVDPSVLKIGDRVRVRPGQKVPIDGKIAEGRTFLDQQVITGESLPVAAEPGSNAFAGTINGDGVIVIEATQMLENTVVRRIAKRVDEARTRRAPIERMVDLFARRYTPMVVVVAALIIVLPPAWHLLHHQPALWHEWLYRGLVLLVIACPCALVISTPVAIVSALANAARHGMMIRDARVIEQFGQISLLAFDKTGTLTLGKPDVTEVSTVSQDIDGNTMLARAAAIGSSGSHVVSRAIVRHAHELNLQIPTAEEVREVPGLGTTGLVGQERIHMGSHRYLDQEGLCQPDFHEGLQTLETAEGTAVAVAGGAGPLGWIRLADQPRAEARDVLKDLKSLNIRTMMLTGDNPVTAEAIARTLGIDDVRARLMPEEKSQILTQLVEKYGLVGMVGDGVNDAPALAAASVGVSMGSIASAVTSQSADVVLINDRLDSLPRLVRLSRKTLRTIRLNVGFALGSKAIVMVFAALGLAHFWLAMMADVGVSLIVVVHSLRLLRFDSK